MRTHSPRTRHLPTWRLATLAALGSVLLATGWTGDWYEPDSALRLLTAPAQHRPHTLRVDLPLDLNGEWRGVRVFTYEGEELPCRPIHLRDRLLAVEVPLEQKLLLQLRQAGRQGRDPLELYLLPEPVDVPEPPAPRTPIALLAGYCRTMGRPETADQYLVFRQRQARLAYRDELADFLLDDESSLARQLRRADKRMKAHLHLATLFLQEDPADLQFGLLNREVGAWYLFVNRKPVTSWGEVEPGEKVGAWLGPRLALDAGLHQLDFFLALDEDEGFPILGWRELNGDEQFRPIAASRLASPHGANAIVRESRDGVLVPGLSWQWLASYSFAGTDTILSRYLFRDRSHNIFDRGITARDLTVGGHSFEFESPNPTLLVPDETWPTWQFTVTDEHGFIEQLSFGAQDLWQPAIRLDIAFRPLAIQHQAPASLPVTFDYHLAPPTNFQAQLVRDGSLRIRHLDAAGRTLDQHDESIPASPFARHLTFNSFPPEAVRSDLTLVMDDFPVAPPILLYHVRPTDEPAFGRSSAMLRYRDGLALLTRPTPPDKPPASRPLPNRLLLVDDYLAAATHLAAGPPSKQELARLDAADLVYYPLHQAADAGHLSVFDKFVRLHEILATDAGGIVWLTGVSELRHGLSVPDYQAELAFLTEACLARGKLPILVNPPLFGDFDQERVRPYALAVMELAASYAVPVVDLYSASLKRQHIDTFFRLDEGGRWRSAIPDSGGRAWFLDRLDASLHTYRDHQRR